MKFNLTDRILLKDIGITRNVSKLLSEYGDWLSSNDADNLMADEIAKDKAHTVCEKTKNIFTYTVKCTNYYNGLNCGWGKHVLYFDPSNTSKIKDDLKRKNQEAGNL